MEMTVCTRCWKPTDKPAYCDACVKEFTPKVPPIMNDSAVATQHEEILKSLTVPHSRLYGRQSGQVITNEWKHFCSDQCGYCQMRK